jgi:hypothetical protein
VRATCQRSDGECLGRSSEQMKMPLTNMLMVHFRWTTILTNTVPTNTHRLHGCLGADWSEVIAGTQFSGSRRSPSCSWSCPITARHDNCPSGGHSYALIGISVSKDRCALVASQNMVKPSLMNRVGIPWSNQTRTNRRKESFSVLYKSAAHMWTSMCKCP